MYFAFLQSLHSTGKSQRENLFKVIIRTLLLEKRSQREERRMKHSLLHLCDSEKVAESISNCS